MGEAQPLRVTVGSQQVRIGKVFRKDPKVVFFPCTQVSANQACAGRLKLACKGLRISRFPVGPQSFQVEWGVGLRGEPQDFVET